MNDRFAPRRNRSFSPGHLFPESDRPRDSRPFYGDDAGINDMPLQFNENGTLSRGQKIAQKIMDNLYPNDTRFSNESRYPKSESRYPDSESRYPDSESMYTPRDDIQRMPAAPMMGPSTYGMMQLEPFHGNDYVLYPADLNISLPIPRERPVGCKTVVFSEIPFELTGDMVRDICERLGGPVETFERARGPFCTIRFCDQSSVDRIFSVHGMQVCVNNSKAPAFSGLLLLDYVQNPRDLQDYELEQRRIARHIRHQEVEQEQPIIDFSAAMIDAVTERIKEDQDAMTSINIVITWLERGYCDKKSASAFYRLISITNSHVKKIQNEKTMAEEALNQAKQQYMSSKGTIVMQLTLIEQVFTSASKKKVWDHFTKAQRKLLDQWCQAVKELRSKEENELRPEQVEEADMDIASEDEDAWRRQPGRKNRKSKKRAYQTASPPPLPAYGMSSDLASSPLAAEVVMEIIDTSDEEEVEEIKYDEGQASGLGEEVKESGMSDLPSERKEMEGEETEGETPPEKKVKVSEGDTGVMEEKLTEEKPAEEESAEEEPAKEAPAEEEAVSDEQKEDTSTSSAERATIEAYDQAKAMEALRRRNKEMHLQLTALKKDEALIKEKETQIKALQMAFVNMQQQLKESKAKLKNGEGSRKTRGSEVGESSTPVSTKTLDLVSDLSMDDGVLMSYISIFLHAHPFGASIDYLYSYLLRLHPTVNHTDIERILQNFPNCFVQELSGVGASLERRWKFVAFKNAMKRS